MDAWLSAQPVAEKFPPTDFKVPPIEKVVSPVDTLRATAPPTVVTAGIDAPVREEFPPKVTAPATFAKFVKFRTEIAFVEMLSAPLATMSTIEPGSKVVREEHPVRVKFPLTVVRTGIVNVVNDVKLVKMIIPL
jgi:hypothetical protein